VQSGSKVCFFPLGGLRIPRCTETIPHRPSAFPPMPYPCISYGKHNIGVYVFKLETCKTKGFCKWLNCNPIFSGGAGGWGLRAEDGAAVSTTWTSRAIQRLQRVRKGGGHWLSLTPLLLWPTIPTGGRGSFGRRVQSRRWLSIIRKYGKTPS